MSSFMSIRQGKPGGFAGLFIIKVRDDKVQNKERGRHSNEQDNISAYNTKK